MRTSGTKPAGWSIIHTTTVFSNFYKCIYTGGVTIICIMLKIHDSMQVTTASRSHSLIHSSQCFSALWLFTREQIPEQLDGSGFFIFFFQEYHWLLWNVLYYLWHECEMWSQSHLTWIHIVSRSAIPGSSLSTLASHVHILVTLTLAQGCHSCVLVA